MTDNLACLCSDINGCNIPKIMTPRLIEAGWTKIDSNCAQILECGPDNALYWEAWSEVVDQAEYTDEQGEVWRLHQDGDLWAYKVSALDAGELNEFFGGYC